MQRHIGDTRAGSSDGAMLSIPHGDRAVHGRRLRPQADRVRCDGGMPRFETLQVERAPPAATIILDRPEALNAITPTMLEELGEAVRWCASDDALRAIILRGAGDRAFSAGFDLHTVSVDDIPATRAALETAQAALDACEEASVPVIAAIDGVCLGGGMELAAAADIRVATTASRFGQPEVRLGLLPGWGGTRRLPSVIGASRARELILRGDARMPAETLAEWGFLSRTVADAPGMDSAIEAIITDIMQSPRGAIAAAKRALVQTAQVTRAPASVEIDAFCAMLETPETIEGITAFREGRDPSYRPG